jgi:hypothetical protein
MSLETIKDTEDLLLKIRSILIAGINARITCLNTEKGDSLLDPFSPDEFFFFFRNKPNLKKFINIYSGDTPLSSNKGGLVQTNDIFIMNYQVEQLNDESFFKSLRYMRAIYETLNRAIFNEIDNSSTDFILEQIAPFDLPEQDNFPYCVVSGVKLSIDILLCG